MVSIYDDRLEIVSLGGLVGRISVEDITYGISMTRNEKIANIFYRLEVVEQLLGIFQTMAGRLLKKLDEENQVIKIGKASNTSYILTA